MSGLHLVISKIVLRRGVHVAVHVMGRSEFVGAATCADEDLAQYLAMSQASQDPEVGRALEREEVEFEHVKTIRR